MEIIEEVYVGKSIQDLGTIVYALKRKIPVHRLYIICMEDTSSFIAEILPVTEFYSNQYRQKFPIIIGFAQGQREAYDLFRFIVQDAVNGIWDLSNLKESICRKREIL